MFISLVIQKTKVKCNIYNRDYIYNYTFESTFHISYVGPNPFHQLSAYARCCYIPHIPYTLLNTWDLSKARCAQKMSRSRQIDINQRCNMTLLPWQQENIGFLIKYEIEMHSQLCTLMELYHSVSSEKTLKCRSGTRNCF